MLKLYALLSLLTLFTLITLLTQLRSKMATEAKRGLDTPYTVMTTEAPMMETINPRKMAFNQT